MSSQALERPEARYSKAATAPALAREDTATARSRSRKRMLSSAALLALALALGWYGYGWWTVARFIESTDDAYVGGDVTVIAPQVSGFIATLAVTDNQPVRAGDLLVRLDDRIYRATLAKADAAVAAEQATLADVAANRTLQLAIIAQAQAELLSTAAAITLTHEDVDRYRTLSNDRFASLQRFQQADAEAREAVAADLKARAVLEASRRRLDVFDTQAQQTRAALQAALADRETARLDVGYTELRAPLDGVIGNRSARLGEFAGVNAQLLSIVPAGGLWVDANFKEDQLAFMRAGQPVTIRADVLPGQAIHGHVDSLAPATGAQFSVLPAENATGNFTKIVQRVPVRIRLDGAARSLGMLRPGLSVTASVDERPEAAAVR